MSTRRSKDVVTLLLLISAIFVTTSSTIGNIQPLLGAPVKPAPAPYGAPYPVANVEPFLADPAITLSPPSARQGINVLLSGSGFVAGDYSKACTVSYSPNGGSFVPMPNAYTCSIDASGNVVTPTSLFTVPSAFVGSGNPYTIRVTGFSGDSATQTFTLVVPSISFSPSSASVGTTIKITGGGFAVGDESLACASVTYTPSGSSSPTPLPGAVCSIDASGNVVAPASQFVVPGAFNGAGNPYTITVTGVTGDVATQTFTVISPTISLSQNSGLVGTLVNIFGNGFAAGDFSAACTVTYTPSGGSSTPVPGAVCNIDASGNVKTAGPASQFNVPNAFVSSGNPYTITVLGLTGDFATAQFTVASAVILLSPTSAAVGFTVSITGTFPTTDAGACTISPSGSLSITPAACTILGSGSLTTSFTVSSVSLPTTNPYTITVTSSVNPSDAPQKPFSVLTPTMTPNTSHAPVGSTVTLTGTGFQFADLGACPATSIHFTNPGATITPVTCAIGNGGNTGTLSGSFKVTSVTSTPSNPYSGLITINEPDTPSAAFTVDTPSIALNPASGPAGATIGISGSGFAITTTGTCVGVSSSPGGAIPSPNCHTDGSGNIVAGSYFVVPNSFTTLTGPFSITVTGPSSDASLPALFALTPAVPGMGLSPSTGSVGTLVTMSGSGWAPGDAGLCTTGGTVTAKDKNGAGVATTFISCSISSSGVLTGAFVVPSGFVPSLNPFTITVTKTGTGDTASAFFTVVVIAPSITVSPSSASIGSIVTISGTGFAPGDASGACTVTAKDKTLTLLTSPPFAGSCSISSSGTVTGSFVVATGTGGFSISGNPFTIIVTGITTDSASAFFAVAPPSISMTLSPISATQGATVIISGSFPSYDAGVSCAVTSSPTTTPLVSGTCSVSGSGSLSGSFVVTTGATGFLTTSNPYKIIVTVGADSAAAFFSVLPPTPTLTLSPSSAAAGSVVLSGGGFNVGDAGACSSLKYGLNGGAAVTAIPTFTCTISPTGTVSGTFLVPPAFVTSGNPYTITVTGITLDSATAYFAVTPIVRIPTITITPSVELPSTTASVTVVASGFSSSDTAVNFAVSPLVGLTMGSTSCTIVGTSGTCTLSTTMTSTSTSRVYIITGTGVGASDTASTNFVVGNFYMNPTSGPPGTLVSVLGVLPGSGDTSCSISMTSIGTSSCVLVTGESFTGSFVVGSIAPGAYLVQVTGAGGTAGNVQGTFIVTGAQITLSPSSGRTGVTVTVSGLGFSFADTTCTLAGETNSAIILNGACTIAGGTGIVSGGFTVGNISPGTYVVRVTGSTNDFAETTFTIVTGPSITLTPNSGGIGITVTVAGSGFRTDDSSCSISGSPVVNPACSITIGTGAPSGSFTVANIAPGTYVITLSANEGDSAQATFKIVTGPSITLTPNSGGTGITVTVAGSGFLPQDGTCSISGTPVQSPACSITLGSGAPTGSFQVSAVASGSYTITLSASSGGDSAQAVFTVTVHTPSLTLTPTYAGPGTTVTFLGLGLQSTDTSCTLTSTPSASTNGATLISSPSCSVSSGTATGSFTVNSLATTDGSPWTVTVTGNPVSDMLSAQFTLVPVIGVSPSSGSFGTVVTVNGFGFSSKATTCSLTSAPTGLFASGTVACSFILPGPNGSGQISGTFTVATSIPAGTYVVTANDNKGNSASTTFTIGTPTAQLTISPNSITPPTSGSVTVAVTGFGFNPVDTGCSVAPIGGGITSGTCSMSGGNAGVTLSIPSSTPSGLYLVTVTGSPNGDFASNYLAVGAFTTATSTTSTTTTSTIPTTTSTTTTSTNVFSSQTTTTLQTTGFSTWIFTSRTATTTSAVTTASIISTIFSTSIFMTTFITTVRTTFTSTLGQIIQPAVSGEMYPDGFGLLALLLLAVPFLLRRLTD